jgi:hypothetical protein
MKKLLRIALFAIIATFGFGSEAKAQIPSVQHLIWGSSPFQDSLWSIDTTNWQVVNRLGPTLPGFTITGMTGLAYDPTTYETYIIMKVSAVSGRVLGKINLQTGVCTQVGNLGDNFSSIAFDETGQLWGATGNGATVPETLYKIDKTTGVKTLQYAMGNGIDGEILCYNRDDNNMYHWSGNGTVVMEKWPLNNVAYTPTNIPISGTSGGETFGMIYMGSGKFIASNIASNLKRLSASGVYGATLSNNPDDLRGIVMPPAFAHTNTNICPLVDTTFIGVGNLTLFDSVIFHWGDGNTTAASAGVSGAFHTYSTGGVYTISIEVDNGNIQDTIKTFTVNVNAAPSVSLSGINTLCPNTSVVISGTAQVTNQWYFNGTPIPSQTSATLSANAPGVYNMMTTNSFGCSDSSHTPFILTAVPNPTVALGTDYAACVNTVLDAGNAGSSFLWSNGDTTQTISVNTSGSYEVMVTDSNNCSASDTIAVVINPLPVVSLGPDATSCGSYTADAQNAGSAYLWSNGDVTQTSNLTSSGTYSVMVTDTNGCSNSDSISVIINPIPVVDLGSDTSGCASVTISPNTSGTFLWSDNSTGSSLTVTASGVYSVMVTDSNGCSAGDSVSVVVNPLPVVGLAVAVNGICVDDADVTLIGTPSGGTFSGTSVTGSQFDPSIGAGNHDVYYSFTDGNGCSASDTLTLIVSACVGITEQAAADLLMYPNPTTGSFTIELPENGSLVVVTDMLGNIIYSERALNSGKNHVELGNQSAGVYFVKVTSGDHTSVNRLVIRK